MTEYGSRGGAALASAMVDIAALLETADGEDALEGIAPDFGSYTGMPPHVALLPDGRLAEMLKPIAYHRPDGSDWPVPAGAKIDGASIPRLFWTAVGGPYEGKYRDASIVHDYYCDTESRPWKDTHRMFHDAMRCSGVGSVKARAMFYAVYRFGPRWADPSGAALESIAVATPRPPVDADAETLRRDIEAIVDHGLDLNEIAALADARADGSGLEALESMESHAADAIVVAGGTASAKDVEVVAGHARALPPYVIARFVKKRIRIIACRGSVTDFERDLAGKIPRGWEKTGRTWDSVPGAYFPDRKRVVIATVAAADGGRVVPGKASGLHGSDDLVVHEALHGYDYSLKHAPLRDPAFLAARKADERGLTDYERQEGDAGREETFAETGAQHLVAPTVLAQRCPTLAGYWRAMPAGEESVLEAAAMPDNRPSAIGVATRESDGRILLDLRATDDSGAIGHAIVALSPGEAEHATIDAALFPGAKEESVLESGDRLTAEFFG